MKMRVLLSIVSYKRLMVFERNLADLAANGQSWMIVVVSEKAVIRDEFLVALGT